MGRTVVEKRANRQGLEGRNLHVLKSIMRMAHDGSTVPMEDLVTRLIVEDEKDPNWKGHRQTYSRMVSVVKNQRLLDVINVRQKNFVRVTAEGWMHLCVLNDVQNLDHEKI